ncbi:MAG TPA: YqiA/YcfP family alpha/beta fold hydrolase [Casimicrobiaceae bacterium]
MIRIVYLHGFNSAPASIKAQLLARAIAELPPAARPEYVIPQLSPRPSEAMRAVGKWVEGRARVSATELTFVGSSLGGFYATYLAERYGAQAVLINPAIDPAIDLASSIGPQRNLYTGEAYELTAEHLAEMATFKIARITRPERYLLLVQTGDELLDYRAAVAFYAGAWQFVQGGGDHAFRDFAAQIPVVLRFAGVASIGGPLPAHAHGG